MTEIKTMAAQDVLIQVLPLLDHLELALKNVNPKFNCNSDCTSSYNGGCDTENDCGHNCDCDVSCNCESSCDTGADIKSTNDSNSTNYTEFIRGIELIHSQLKELLANNHLEQIKAVGEQFDPYYHEALIKVESDFPAGIILEEFQKGFTLHGKVIRHAKVKVSSGLKTNKTK